MRRAAACAPSRRRSARDDRSPPARSGWSCCNRPRTGTPAGTRARRSRAGGWASAGSSGPRACRPGVDELGDRDLHRAALDAHRVLAAQAAFGLECRVRQRVALVDLAEVVRALLRVAYRHRRLVCAFDRHQRDSLAAMHATRLAAIFSSATYALLRRIATSKSTWWASEHGPATHGEL